MNPLRKDSFSKLKNELMVHNMIMPDNANDPKGMQKQNKTGKK